MKKKGKKKRTEGRKDGSKEGRKEGKKERRKERKKERKKKKKKTNNNNNNNVHTIKQKKNGQNVIKLESGIPFSAPCTQLLFHNYSYISHLPVPK